MKQNYLNGLYSQYKKGTYSRDEFEGLVYQYFVKNQEKTSLNNWKYSEYEDFLSWYYLRLRKAVDSYREESAPFESYICSVIRLAAREYRVQTITKSVIEYSAWSIHVPELYAQEEAPAYSYESQEKAVSHIIKEHKIMKSPKQLLTLILKCYYYVSDDFLDRIACYTGIDRDKLQEAVNKLRDLRQKKDDHIYRMKERIYCQYYRCIVYEKRLSYLSETSLAHLRLKQRLEKARQRLKKMRKRVNAIRTDATNREIAEVIGVSKGTVDSTLYRLKTKWNFHSDKSILN